MANLPVAIERGHPSGSFDPKLPLTSGGLVSVPGVDSKTRNLSMTLDGRWVLRLGHGWVYVLGRRKSRVLHVANLMHISQNRNC